MKKEKFDVIIVGGGPAGCSAAVYCASRGCNVAIFEKNDIGGTIGKVSTVTHYLSVDNEETGESFSKKLKNQLDKYNIKVIYEEVKSMELNNEIKKIFTNIGEYEGNSVILAMGLTPKKFDVLGADKFINRGIYRNARKYGSLFKDKEIFVVGGADGAIKEAIYLAKIVKKVNIIHFEDKLNPIKEFKNQLDNLDNIEIILNSKITKIDGNNEIEEIEVENIKDGSKMSIKTLGCGIFPYIGGDPKINKNLGIILNNEFIQVNNNMETNIPGVFAAGDICLKNIRQVSTAVSDGTIAGITSSLYIK